MWKIKFIFHLSFGRRADRFNSIVRGARNSPRRIAMANERCQMTNGKYLFRTLCLCVSVAYLMTWTACVQQMGTQPRGTPLEPNTFFRDGQSARPVVGGTVPSNYTRSNQRVETPPAFDSKADSLPFPLTKEVLDRGRERFNIYCVACHGTIGYGDGIVVQRGLSRPPSYHEDRLRQAPLGHFYDVMTNGFGAMGSYAAQVEPKDRWAIAAYIRALQVSQRASLDDVPPEKRSQLDQGGHQSVKE